MAFVNPSKPAGLSPIAYLSGAAWNGQARMYFIAAADTNGYWPGDVVTLAAAGDAATGIAGVTLATAGNPAVGVVVAVAGPNNSVSSSGNGGGAGGPPINPNNLLITARPAAAQTTGWYAWVADDPNLIFEIQEGGAGTNLTQAVLGNNANFIYAAGTTVGGNGYGYSGTTLNNGSVANTATLNLKIYSFAQRIDNHFVTSPTTGGGAQKWWVLLNNHQYKGGTGTLGV
jgi:hypothetical protein